MDPIARMVAAGAAGAGGAGDPVYVDDVFSTFLYDGTGSAQTITNGIDLAGKGGLVWAKVRNSTIDHHLVDTERGGSKYIRSSSSNSEATDTTMITSFNSDGFSIGSSVYFSQSPRPYATWTFRKAPGFFDIQTWTGNGVEGRQISHNLGSTPGMIMIKRTGGGGVENWVVYHRSMGIGQNLTLNEAYGANSFTYVTSVSDTAFGVSMQFQTNGNDSSATYVAYIFAHDDQSFGTNGDESTIKCGSYTGTGNSSKNFINLGFEPQWLMIKNATEGSTNWVMIDVMRGWRVLDDTDPILSANIADAESVISGVKPFATGFELTGNGTYTNWSGKTFIYMAIRRPHKPPTAGTEVFKPAVTTSTPVSVDFPTDLIISAETASGGAKYLVPRLTNGYLVSSGSIAETDASSYFKFDLQNSFSTGSFYGSLERVNYYLRRAPGFFDVVAYEGTGSVTTVNHNLAAVPELILLKGREDTYSWSAYTQTLGRNKILVLNNDEAASTFNAPAFWGSTDFTSTQFSLGTYWNTNRSGYDYVAYLFASLDGISKVGSYSGTGSNINVDCGFTAGARFVLIKRTDGSDGAHVGDWYVWDTARGIVSGNDPYLLFNSSAAPVTNTDYIDPLNSGFTVTSSAPAALNANGGTYLFLAIA